MSKFEADFYDKESIDAISASLEFEDKQTRMLVLARSHLLQKLDIHDLSNKELILLSHFLRQILNNEKKDDHSRSIEPPLEAAERWFQYITGYHITDFRGKYRRERRARGLPLESGKLIRRLRDKFDRGDD